VLYLFGTPGQARFLPMWDDICRGAIGALVIVDPNRLAESFSAVNYFEFDTLVPFVVGVNVFNGTLRHTLDQIRQALALPARIPMITFDARDRSSVARSLLAVVDHAIAQAPVTAGASVH
jgi:signal recognition particle receptor subunit beta